MTQHDDTTYVNHILECIEDIAKYTKNDKRLFEENDMVRNAALRQLQIMSESTTRLSDKIKIQLPEIEWRKLAAFRNILVHDYLGEVDHDLVWQHIQKRLPELKAAMQKIQKGVL